MFHKKILLLVIASLFIGALTRFLWFKHNSSDQNTQVVNEKRQGDELPFNLNENESSNHDSLKQKIAQQKITILTLKNELEILTSKLNEKNNQPQITDSENTFSELASNKSSSLKKMNMKDFEQLTKDTFLDKFKGVVLSISGKQLESLKKSFELTSEQDEKALQYQNNISDYLLNNNLYSEHFVDDIHCLNSICRLEVSTSNEENWNQIYADMTRQSWYNSITFEEESDFPGQHIYYLPNITD